MQFPMIHLNGTSREELVKQYKTAAESLHKAITDLRAAAPHGRDYYLAQYHDASSLAMREHVERLQKLESVSAELYALWEHVAEASPRPPGDSWGVR